jgi:hypothetical protein
MADSTKSTRKQGTPSGEDPEREARFDILEDYVTALRADVKRLNRIVDSEEEFNALKEAMKKAGQNGDGS